MSSCLASGCAARTKGAAKGNLFARDQIVNPRAMRLFFASMIFLAAHAQPYPTKRLLVPPGSRGDVGVAVMEPTADYWLDVLTDNPSASITLSLPDNSELTQANAEDGSWLVFSSSDLKKGSGAAGSFSGAASVLLRGSGWHTLIAIDENSPRGDYKIHIDGRRAQRTTTAFACAIPAGDLVTSILRTRPGVRISKPVAVSPGSAPVVLEMSPPRTDKSVMLDIAFIDPAIVVSVKRPDGRLLEGERIEWPPWNSCSEFDCVGWLLLAGSVLPITGSHYLISIDGPPGPGTYTIELDARNAKKLVTVTAMFSTIPDPEDLISQKVGPEDVQIVYGNVESGHFAGDPIDIALAVQGVSLQGPVHCTTTTTVKLLGRDEPARPVNIEIPFHLKQDGRYHGAFIPLSGGLYEFTVTVSGTSAGGRRFTERRPISVLIQPLVARVDRLTEKTLDTDGNGRPDRLDITAHASIMEPGQYRFAVDLGDATAGLLRKETTANLQTGPQELTVSFNALELRARMKKDGPYGVRVSLERSESPTTSTLADVRAGASYTTEPYRREDWDPGRFYGTERIAGAGVDLKGDGKFQIYRVRWDVVTPGGECTWWAWADANDEVREVTETRGRARLNSGPATLDFDYDGLIFKEPGGTHHWKVSVLGIECDGKPMPSTQEDLIRFDAGMLRAEDFEPEPPDFRIVPAPAELTLHVGGVKSSFPVTIEPIGRIAGPVQLRVLGLPATIKAEPASCGSSLNCDVSFFSADSAQPGEYPTRVVVSAGGREHEMPLQLIVQPAAPGSVLGSRPPKLAGPVRVALVVGTNGGMVPGCAAMKQMAHAIAGALQPGTDALALITFRELAQVSMPLTTGFGGLLPDALHELDDTPCKGPSNSVYGLEQARDQLSHLLPKGTEQVIVLITSGPPTVITTNWPVRTQADVRFLSGKAVSLPPSNCGDTQGRHFPDPEWASGNSMPDRAGALAEFGFDLVGPLLYTDGRAGIVHGLSVLLPDPDCDFEGVRSRPNGMRDVAFLPEADLDEVSLDGPRRLVRFDNGPYRGHIRPDSGDNIRDALGNLFQNTLTRLVDEGIHVFVLYFNPRVNPDGFQNVLNIPGSAAWSPEKPWGLLITLHDDQQVPHAIDQIRAAIGSP